jgi:hypothetical protein
MTLYRESEKCPVRKPLIDSRNMEIVTLPSPDPVNLDPLNTMFLPVSSSFEFPRLGLRVSIEKGFEIKRKMQSITCFVNALKPMLLFASR